MIRTPLMAIAMAVALASGFALHTQAAPPDTVTVVKVDPQVVATGHRASKLIGSAVVNEAGDTIASIDDIILTKTSTHYAILSIGGVLGMGSRLVVVPLSALTMTNGKVMLPGSSKQALEHTPEYKYPQ